MLGLTSRVEGMVRSNGSISRNCGNFAATNDELILTSSGASKVGIRSWLVHAVAGGTHIHGFTIEVSAEAVAAICGSSISSGRHTLGVDGVRRPSSAAVMKDIGGDEHGATTVFLTGVENLISRVDHSVSEICWRRGAGVGAGGVIGGCHLTIGMGERSRSGS